MLVEGKDENGNRVVLQAVRRGKTVYLRRAAKQLLDLSARTPRQLWYLGEVTKLFSEQFGEKSNGPLPVTAEVLRKAGTEIAAKNPYPKKRSLQVERQKQLLSLIPEESQSQMRVFGALPTAVEKGDELECVSGQRPELLYRKIIVLRHIERSKEESDSR